MTTDAIDPNVLADLTDDDFASMMQKVRDLYDSLPPEEQVVLSSLIYAGVPGGASKEGEPSAAEYYRIDSQMLFELAPPPPPPSTEKPLPEAAVQSAMRKLVELQESMPETEQAALGLLAYSPRKESDVEGFWWWMYQPSAPQPKPVAPQPTSNLWGGMSWLIPAGAGNFKW